MSKFKFKSARVSLVDSKEFDFIDAYGDKLATFTLRCLDHNNPEIKAIYIELNNKNASNKGTVNNDAAVRAFVRACVLGWDMEDADGKLIPFSTDTAVEFFTMKDEDSEQPNARVLATLIGFCQDESNFAQPREIAKNS